MTRHPKEIEDFFIEMDRKFYPSKKDFETDLSRYFYNNRGKFPTSWGILDLYKRAIVRNWIKYDAETKHYYISLNKKIPLNLKLEC